MKVKVYSDKKIGNEQTEVFADTLIIFKDGSYVEYFSEHGFQLEGKDNFISVKEKREGGFEGEYYAESIEINILENEKRIEINIVTEEEKEITLI